MDYLIDTDVAIHLRDGTAAIQDRIAALGGAIAISVVTLVELQAGAAEDRSTSRIRAALVAELRKSLPVLTFGEPEADAYHDIIAACGYERRKVLDRMIAAQAIVAERRLITINGRDFADVPGLDLEVWESPA